jgi:hypothetical protein
VGCGPVTARQHTELSAYDPGEVFAAICFIAVIAWVTDQTLGDVRQIWRAHRRRR